MCRDVLSWFVMSRDVLSWFVMSRDVLSWFVMFHCHGFVMVVMVRHVTDPDLLIPIKQTRVTTTHSDLREPQPLSSDSSCQFAACN